MPDYKQVIVFNKNSKISFNKSLDFIVRGSLDSVESSLQSSRTKVDNWLRFGQKKVTVQVTSDTDLLNVQKICKNKKIVNVLEVTENNIPVVLVIGPDLEKVLDPITGHLKLF